MPITAGIISKSKQRAADAIVPAGAVIKAALIKVGYTGTYGDGYQTYVAGMAGDEVATGSGYTQGGYTLPNRTAGAGTSGAGWVDFDDAVWTAVGTLSGVGLCIYDSTNGNRVIGFVDFGGTKSVTNGEFRVQIPSSGTGFVRVT